MFEPLVNWIIVLVFRTTLFLRRDVAYVKFRILSNIIMLWRIDGETISVVVLGFVKAKWSAFVAMVVVFPVCRPIQATIRGDLSFSNSSWYLKGLKFKRSSAKRLGSVAKRFKASWSLIFVSASCIGFWLLW